MCSAKVVLSLKTANKILSIILAVAMLLSIAPLSLTASAASGTCGDNLTWTLNESTGKLTVSGTGDMYDWSSSFAPWYSYRSSIKSVTIGNGVTSIGDYAFSNCTNLVSITIPESVTNIGNSVFAGCEKLVSVTLPTFVNTFGSNVFYNCKSLTNITIPNGVESLYGTFSRWIC